MKQTAIVSVALALALAQPACVAERSPEVLVVVQETNVPFAACDTVHEYTQALPSPCGGLDLHVQICTDEPLCQSQIDALIAPIASCEEARRNYRATPSPDC